jgi:hypothetical protein
MMVRAVLEDVVELSMLGSFLCAIAFVARGWSGV